MGSFGLAEVQPPLEVFAYTVSARTTHMARRLVARGSLDGTSYRYVEFSVGRGGYDPFDLTKVVPVDPNAATLIDPVLSSQAIDKMELPNPQSTGYYCLLESGEANYLLGEIGVWSIIQNSPIASENGTKFLSAIGHFPAKAKNSDMQMALRVIQQL